MVDDRAGLRAALLVGAPDKLRYRCSLYPALTILLLVGRRISKTGWMSCVPESDVEMSWTKAVVVAYRGRFSIDSRMT